MLNACMVMLASAATKAAALADQGYDMEAFEQEVVDVSKQLQQLSHQRAVQAQVTLPPSMQAGEILGTYTSFALSLPPEQSLPDAVVSLEERRRRAADNLGSYFLLPCNITFSNFVQALRKTWPDSPLSFLHRMKSIERAIFSRVAAGINTNPLSEAEVTALEQVVDIYSGLLRAFSNTPAAHALMATELRSREVLVVWAAYCLMDASARHHHPQLMAPMEVSLHGADLRHLVLSDRAAVDTARLVCDYLRAHHKGICSELFSLRDGGRATFTFALRFAEQDAKLQDIWRDEKSGADVRKDRHWAEVARKQQQAHELTSSLKHLRSELDDKLSDLSAARSTLNQYCYYPPKLRSITPAYAAAQGEESRCQREVSQVQHRISSVQGQLQDAEKAPPAVIQPLPQQPDKALQWLFFLHMPPVLKQLSRASFLAQQLLLPRLLSTTSMCAIQVPDLETPISQHYNNHQSCAYYSPTVQHTSADGKVFLVSTKKVPNVKEIQLKHVDDYTSPSHGVWYPDDLCPEMAWRGSGSSADTVSDRKGRKMDCYFNPFASISPLGRYMLLYDWQLPHSTASLYAAAWLLQNFSRAVAVQFFAMTQSPTQPEQMFHDCSR
jgi:hypothetical protein